VGYDNAHKLVSTTIAERTVTRLFDLGADPDESRPVADEPAHASLHAMLAAFSAVPRPINAAPPPVIDAEREVKLRALGYVR
jgi:hypothetical protein